MLVEGSGREVGRFGVVVGLQGTKNGEARPEGVNLGALEGVRVAVDSLQAEPVGGGGCGGDGQCVDGVV